MIHIQIHMVIVVLLLSLRGALLLATGAAFPAPAAAAAARRRPLSIRTSSSSSSDRICLIHITGRSRRTSSSAIATRIRGRSIRRTRTCRLLRWVVCNGCLSNAAVVATREHSNARHKGAVVAKFKVLESDVGYSWGNFHELCVDHVGVHLADVGAQSACLHELCIEHLPQGNRHRIQPGSIIELPKSIYGGVIWPSSSSSSCCCCCRGCCCGGTCIRITSPSRCTTTTTTTGGRAVFAQVQRGNGRSGGELIAFVCDQFFEVCFLSGAQSVQHGLQRR
mmetsp:Transcript_19304/g.32725  ORF Transcript_19304/g.32725 Transcript_19304/m.32725 type:complete len:279 (-) Transcript_19304:750-1586(-)